MPTCEKIGVNWRLGDDVKDETMGHNFCSVAQFVNR